MRCLAFTVLSLTNVMLQRYGYHVITSPNAEETFHLFEVFPDIHVDERDDALIKA
jgi:hypothetical protein